MTVGLTIVIRAGDTLVNLCPQLGPNFTVGGLEFLNHNIDPDNLQIGSLLVIDTQEGLTVEVREGDTAFEIASAAGIDTAELQARNPGVNFDDLQIGSDLVIVAGGPVVIPP